MDIFWIQIRSSLGRLCWGSFLARCAKGPAQSIFKSWREGIQSRDRQALMGSTSCLTSVNCPSFRTKARSNSLANLKPLSARDAIQVLSVKVSSFRGCNAMPRGDREPADFVRRNAPDLPHVSPQHTADGFRFHPSLWRCAPCRTHPIWLQPPHEYNPNRSPVAYLQRLNDLSNLERTNSQRPARDYCLQAHSTADKPHKTSFS